jgi:hypothetical protein
MAVLIQRTPIIDDDLTGTIGTVIDNAWKQQFYNQIDAALAGVGASADLAVISNAQTGTLTDWIIAGRTRNTYVNWTGTAAAQVTGIAGGVIGDRVIFRNSSATGVLYFHNLYLSAAANQFRCFCTSAATPVAPGGAVTFVYGGAVWVMESHEQGAWIASVHSAGSFTASGSMIWTVEAADLFESRWRLSGRQLHFNFNIAAASISGTVHTTLYLSTALCGGFTMPAQTGYARLGFHNQAAEVMVSGSGAALQLQFVNGGNFALGTNNWYFYGSWIGSVN